MTTNTDTQAHGGGVEAVREALATAEPFVELLHSLTGEKRARAIVWKALKQIRAALAASPAAPAPAAGVDQAVERLSERDEKIMRDWHADTMCMTGDMWMKIKEALASTLVAKTASPANRYMGMDIASYPAGTTVYDKKTGQRAVIDENSVLCVTRSDVVIIEPAARAAL